LNEAGAKMTVWIPVIDELGLIVTKCTSVKSLKRDRDALDLYFAVAQARSSKKLIEQLRLLEDQSQKAYLALGEFLKWLERSRGFEDRFEIAVEKLPYITVAPEEAKRRIIDVLREGGISPGS